MGGSKFIPIVIAGVVGLFIGWIVSPDVDDVSDEVNGHVDTLKGPIEQIQAQLKSLTEQVAKPAPPAPVQASSDQPSKTDTAVAALGDKIDQLTSDLQARIDAVGKAIEQQPAPQPQAAAPSGGEAGGDQGSDPEKLASQIGKTGAILLPGQAAIFAGQRVSLASLSAADGGASITVGDGKAADVKSGSAVDVSDDCKVTLAGVAAGAAYFSASDCQGGASSGGQPQGAADTAPKSAASGDRAKAVAQSQQQAAAGGQGEQKPADSGAASASASGDSGTNQKASASKSKPDAAPAETGSATEATVPVGGTATLGGKRIFVSAIGENNASLFVAGDFKSGGQTRQSVEVGKSMDAGDGCKIKLASIDNSQAKLTSDGCIGGAATAEPTSKSNAKEQAASDQQSEAPAARDASKTSAPSPSSASTGGEQKPAGSTTSQASPGGGALSVGQTGTYGDHKVFVSSIGDGAATLYVVGTGREEVKAGSPVDLGGGCSLTLDKIQNGAVTLSAKGC